MSDWVLSAVDAPAPGAETSGLEIRLFGPLEVRIGPHPLPRLRTRKGLWLLALLALRAGRDVERDWLAGTLWPDGSEAQARRSLRQSLHDLRLALGPEAWRLTGEPPRMLRLDLVDAFVDALAFDTAIARRDLASLEAAVRLYRGPLLAECAEEWVLEERQWREQAYLAALQDLSAAATERGGHEAAANYLRLAVGADPYQEELQRALMQTLADRGSPVSALLVYRQFRALLSREMAAEPAAETTALFRRLREETRARVRPRVPTPPGGTAPLSPALTNGNLPQPLSAFVGRQRELLEVGACLASARLVTLTGTGGIGKTRLAIRVAEEGAEEYADGAWFVDLAALADAALVPQAVARALRVREVPGCSLTQTLQEALRSRQLLLVLDNCEHLIDACARLADALLSGCPHLRILATSRQALGLTGETVWPVSPLSLPEPAAPETRRRTPEALMEFEAIRLFVERAAAASPGFALGESNSPATVQVCRRLDGIPLAIELAAARLKAISIEQIAARLDDRFRLLTGGSRAALPRQQTLRATIDWSYELLAEPERVLMRRLSVFTGGSTLEAAEAVGADPVPSPHPSAYTRLRPESVLDLLTNLVEKSLVVYEQQEPRARYRLMETLHQYFSERLLESGEGEATRGRHLDYFLAMAEAAEPQLTGAQQVEWLERLETEHDNLRAALAFSRSDYSDCGLRIVDCGLTDGTSPHPQSTIRNPQSEDPRGEMGLRLAGALWRFWSVRGYLTEGREQLALALASAPRATAARAKALETAGSLAYRQAEYQSAHSLQEESLAIRRELGDGPGIAASLRNLGLIAYKKGDYSAARSLHEESLAIRRTVEDQWGIAASLFDLGVIVHQQGDYSAARSLHEESLAIRRELGDRVGIATSLRTMGRLAYQQGDFAAARSLYEESLAMGRELGDRFGIAASLDALGMVAHGQGEYGAARSLQEESLAIRRELGDRWGIAASLRNLGLIAYQQGDNSATRSFYEECLAIRRALGNRWEITDSLYDLGITACRQGEYDAARSLHEESLAIRRNLGDRLRIADSLEALAALACEGPGQRGACEGAGAGGELPELEVADSAGAVWRAARLFGAAAALREAIGAPMPPSEHEAYRRQVCRAREMLGEEAFAAAWAEGRAMTLDQAITDALREARGV